MRVDAAAAAVALLLMLLLLLPVLLLCQLPRLGCYCRFCFTLQSITVTCPVWAVSLHVYLLHAVLLLRSGYSP